MFRKKQNLNAEIPGEIKVRDIVIKIGRVVGEKGSDIGKKIDEATKNITIKIEK